MAERSQAVTHSPEEWESHLNLIARLYIEQRLSHEDIADHLATLNFPAAPTTVKKWLGKWRIARFNPQDELRLMAGCLLHYRQQGKNVSFHRFDEEFPLEKVNEFVQRNPDTQPNAASLPKHLKVFIQSADGSYEAVQDSSDGQDHTELAAFSMPMQESLLSRYAEAERLKKKRRRTILSSRPRYNRTTRQQPEQNDTQQLSSGAPAVYVDDNSDDERENSATGSSGLRLQDIRKAIAAMQSNPRSSDVKERTFTEALKTLEKLAELRKDADTSKKEKDKEKEGKEDEEKEKEMRQTDMGPIHLAVFRNNFKLLKALLARHADINARGGLGNTALHIAAGKDYIDILKFLVAQDATELDAVDHAHRTALVFAISCDSLRCASLLVLSGADVDICGKDGMTALHLTCMSRNMLLLLTQILAQTKKLNDTTDNGWTPMHVALGAKNWDYIIPLLDAGADLNVQDKNGRTAIHQACFDAPPDLLLKMLEKDVDLSIKGEEDETALHILCQRDEPEVIKAMLNKPKVDINARASNGATPLILASNNNCFETVKILVQRSADMTVLDADMDTALTVAIAKNHDDIAEYLINNGSPVDPQNQSLARHKEELENHRKAREAESVLAAMGSKSKRVTWPTNVAKVMTHYPEQLKSPKSAIPDVQGIEVYINNAVSQAMAQALAQNASTTYIRAGPGTGIMNTAGAQFSHVEPTANALSMGLGGPSFTNHLNTFNNFDLLMSGNDNDYMSNEEWMSRH